MGFLLDTEDAMMIKSKASFIEFPSRLGNIINMWTDTGKTRHRTGM